MSRSGGIIEDCKKHEQSGGDLRTTGTILLDRAAAGRELSCCLCNDQVIYSMHNRTARSHLAVTLARNPWQVRPAGRGTRTPCAQTLRRRRETAAGGTTSKLSSFRTSRGASTPFSSRKATSCASFADSHMCSMPRTHPRRLCCPSLPNRHIPSSLLGSGVLSTHILIRVRIPIPIHLYLYVRTPGVCSVAESAQSCVPVCSSGLQLDAGRKRVVSAIVNAHSAPSI